MLNFKAHPEDVDFVVQLLHESERHLVLWVVVGGDSIPVPIDHLSEFLAGLKPLPPRQRGNRVDYISIGTITKNIKAVDLSMRFIHHS